MVSEDAESGLVCAQILLDRKSTIGTSVLYNPGGTFHVSIPFWENRTRFLPVQEETYRV